jgi:murein DD-endopeptidase MepM/ murein hydrolase activator NlpD
MSTVWNIATLAAVFGLLLPVALFAQSAEDIRNQIGAQRQQLDALNKEIATYEKELQAVGAKKQTLQSAVNSLDLSVKKTQTKIKAIQNQISTTELEIRELGGHIEDKEKSITMDASAIAESIRSLNENDAASMAEMIFGNVTLSDIWDDTETTRAFQENLKSHVDSLFEAKEVLTENKEEEEKKRAQLVGQRTNLKSEEQSLGVQKKEQQTLLAQTKNQESNYQSIIAQKQAAKASFESALNDLESKLKYTLDPAKLPAAGKGILRWPLDNIRITQQFGRTADSGRLYASGTHNGVDFAASIGTPVKAALSGTVMATGNTDAISGCYSYGKWVLLKHANGLATLYAHLSQINVAEGGSVSTGQAVGYSGNTGYATGPHLHFTVYAAGAVQVRPLGSGKGCNAAVMPVSAMSGYLNPMDYL